MTSGFAAAAGRKVLSKHLTNYTPADPLYETYTDKKGRERTRRVNTLSFKSNGGNADRTLLQRDLPPGLSKRDAKILKSVRRRAHYLDKGFHICGMRFSWTFIIGRPTEYTYAHITLIKTRRSHSRRR